LCENETKQQNLVTSEIKTLQLVIVQLLKRKFIGYRDYQIALFRETLLCVPTDVQTSIGKQVICNLYEIFHHRYHKQNNYEQTKQWRRKFRSTNVIAEERCYLNGNAVRFTYLLLHNIGSSAWTPNLLKQLLEAGDVTN
jgi:hypothetical protein